MTVTSTAEHRIWISARLLIVSFAACLAIIELFQGFMIAGGGSVSASMSSEKQGQAGKPDLPRDN